MTAPKTDMPPPEVLTLRARLRQLRDLQRRVAHEIDVVTDQLAIHTDGRRIYRSRHRKPPCGTEAGYQWHRYNEPDNWPLPKDDPCGCRAGHARRRRIAEQIVRYTEPDITAAGTDADVEAGAA